MQTFTVNCELSKKVTAGGFKWIGAQPGPGQAALLDAYPTGGGYTVRLYSAFAGQIAVYANCVKSRKQTGTPPS